MLRRLFLVLLILLSLMKISFAEELIHAPAAIQISSTVSDGKLSLKEIVKIADESGTKVVILADRDFANWQYGVSPLQRIIKRTLSTNSISTYGFERYFNEVEGLQKMYPDLVIIPGVDSAPFYYWSGSLFDKNLTIHNWHKHLIAFGMREWQDYMNIPVVSNPSGLVKRYSLQDLIHFWPLLVLILAVLYCRVRRPRRYHRQRTAIGMVIIVISSLLLINNFPFRTYQYDQYHGNQGIRPYQNYINYVNQRGGLTFWTHPEAENIQRTDRVGIETRRYPEALLDSIDYTGFSYFYEGATEVGSPGGLWDEVLKQYCRGERKNPIWAIGTLACDRADLQKSINNLQTILLLSELTEEAALTAFRKGRIYISRGNSDQDLILDRFIVKDRITGYSAIMGAEIDIKTDQLIKINGHFADGQSREVKIKLIRNGEVIQNFEVTTPININHHDEYFESGKKVYYRLEISYPGKVVITNPIFVQFGDRKN